MIVTHTCGAEPSLSRSLQRAIRQKTALVGVVGLGYVGLPVAAALVKAGFRTLGFDVDTAKIQRLRAGESYIQRVHAQDVARWVAEGRFLPSDDMGRLDEADALLVCVPTPLTDSRDPDLSFVEGTARRIAAVLRAGQLIVLESTTYPGTTRDVVLPILAASGLAAGREFFLAYCPEREDPGNARHSLHNVPRVLGGLDPPSTRVAQLLYEQIAPSVHQVSSLEAAEASKMLENTYRAVNIALVNELKVIFERMGVDVWEVIHAASTKAFGFQPFYPGPGLGGHCIPIDPFYLSFVARKHGHSARFIELAGEVNRAMPQRVYVAVVEALNLQRPLAVAGQIHFAHGDPAPAIALRPPSSHSPG